MEVYILNVMPSCYGQGEVDLCGIYSTKEKAQAAKEKLIAETKPCDKCGESNKYYGPYAEEVQ